MPCEINTVGSSSYDRNILRVTHIDFTALSQNKVRKTFKQFGRIISLEYNHKNAFWNVEYENDKKISRIREIMENSNLNGYKPYYKDKTTSGNFLMKDTRAEIKIKIIDDFKWTSLYNIRCFLPGPSFLSVRVECKNFYLTPDKLCR